MEERGNEVDSRPREFRISDRRQNVKASRTFLAIKRDRRASRLKGLGSFRTSCAFLQRCPQLSRAEDGLQDATVAKEPLNRRNRPIARPMDPAMDPIPTVVLLIGWPWFTSLAVAKAISEPIGSM